MAKCYVCGKRGFFLKVNEHGRCRTCEEEYQRRESQRRFRELQKNKECVPVESSKTAIDATEKVPTIKRTNPTGHSTYILNNDRIEDCSRKFISFDLETTGFDPVLDSIIEISAVTFIDLKVANSFQTYVNPLKHIPQTASSVNHITDETVQNSPLEYDAIQNFVHYLGEGVLKGEVILVAHNAEFDIRFLMYAFSRCGIEARIEYFDTLFIARSFLEADVKSKSLGSLASYFGFNSDSLHSAKTDALLCGQIFIKLIEIRNQNLSVLYSSLNEFELEICNWFKHILVKNDCDVQLLHFNNSSYLTVYCLYPVIKFKPRARRPYVIVNGSRELPPELEFSPCTKSEGEGLVRFYFDHISDLSPLEEHFVSRYNRVFKRAQDSLGNGTLADMKNAAKTINSRITI